MVIRHEPKARKKDWPKGTFDNSPLWEKPFKNWTKEDVRKWKEA